MVYFGLRPLQEKETKLDNDINNNFNLLGTVATEQQMIDNKNETDIDIVTPG